MSDTAINDFTICTIDEDGLFASHGMCTPVKKELAGFCKIIKGTSKQVLWLEIGEEVLGYKIIVSSTYLYESYRYYSADLFDDVWFVIMSLTHLFAYLGMLTPGLVYVMMILTRMIMLLNCMVYRNMSKSV